MTGYMFDTNIFNHILDGGIELVPNPDSTFIITHVQRDEIEATGGKNPARKELLISLLNTIAPQEMPTESAVCNESRLGKAKLSDGKLYNKLREKLDQMAESVQNKEKKKANNPKDALIAETAIVNGLTLVTDDSELLYVTHKAHGAVCNLQHFLKLQTSQQ